MLIRCNTFVPFADETQFAIKDDTKRHICRKLLESFVRQEITKNLDLHTCTSSPSRSIMLTLYAYAISKTAQKMIMLATKREAQNEAGGPPSGPGEVRPP